MTRQENLIYRKQCPYDAMGDYSVLMENEKNIKGTQMKGRITPLWRFAQKADADAQIPASAARDPAQLAL